jgi:hypothetical protein
MYSEQERTAALGKEGQAHDYGKAYSEVQKRYLEELNRYHKQIKKIRKSSSGTKAA